MDLSVGLPEEEQQLVHHPKTCGPCADCAEALTDYAELRPVEPGRDPWVSYGIPPRAVYGRDRAFEAPSRVRPEPGATVHWVVFGPDGCVDVPTLCPTKEQMERHIRRYGPEGTARVRLADPPGSRRRRGETRRLVLEMAGSGSTRAEIMAALGLSRSSVDRHLADGGSGRVLDLAENPS